MTTLAEILRPVLWRAPAVLVSSAAQRRLRRLGGRLRGERGNVLLECRMDPRDDRVDLSVDLSATVDTATRHGLRSLWLEYDLPLSDPSARTAPERNGLPTEPNLMVGVHRRTPARLLRQTVSAARGFRSAADGRRMRTSRQALPASGWTSGVGVMRQRPGRPLQWFVQGLSPGVLLRWLSQRGEGALPSRMEAILRSLCGADVAWTLAVAPLAKTLPTNSARCSRIGLEVRVRDPRPSRQWQQWRRLFRRWTARGWAGQAKTDALSRWPGAEAVSPPDVWWPCLRVRTLSHVKFVVLPHDPPRLKAYLWTYRIDGRPPPLRRFSRISRTAG